jgi:hypothetical protein
MLSALCFEDTEWADGFRTADSTIWQLHLAVSNQQKVLWQKAEQQSIALQISSTACIATLTLLWIESSTALKQLTSLLQCSKQANLYARSSAAENLAVCTTMLFFDHTKVHASQPVSSSDR